MKTSSTFWGPLLLSAGTIHTANAAKVSFDDIPMGSDWAPVQNGYGGLNWSGFGVFNGMLRPVTEGYRTGVVSESNVLFNLGGNPASIRSSTPFNLESAFLTSAFVTDLRLEVQGWAGTRLAYQNTYTLNLTGPTLVQFNYSGVDRVSFVPTPMSWFVMDDVVVSPGESSSCPFAFSPQSLAHGPGAETGTVSVATTTGCAWAVQNLNTWVTILSSQNNSGNGSVTYRVASNPRAIARSGVINIAGRSFAVSQASGQTPLTHTPVDLGTVVVSTIGSISLSDPFFPEPYDSVMETLIDQGHTSGGGGELPSVAVNWDTNIQFMLNVSAPPGQRFVINVPSGRTAIFGGFLWWNSGGGGSSPRGPVSVRFDGLEGTPPDFAESDAVLADSQGFFGFADITSTSFSNRLAFRSMTLTGTVEPQYAGYEIQTFVPHNSSSLQIVYQSDADDVGPIVTIVPEPSAPRIRLETMLPGNSAKLMVQGRAGQTHVVEASSDLIQWTPISTNVMPATVCPTCPFLYVQDSATTQQGYRFYRAYEAP